MATMSEDLKKIWLDFVAEFRRRRKEVDTMVDETVVPDEPNEADKPEGWRDPAEPETPDRGDRAPGEAVPAEVVPEESPAGSPVAPGQEGSPDEAASDEYVGEDTGELPLTELAQQVIAGEWGTGQERRVKLSEAGYDVKAVESEVTWILNNR